MDSYYIGNNFVVNANKMIIDGKEVPPIPGKHKGYHSVTSVNGSIYIDGYEWTGECWKKTFKAWWYKWF